MLGALCVLDYKPRQFSENEQRFLQVMAEEVMEAINNHPALPQKAADAVEVTV